MRAAILLLECIESFAGSPLFGDRKIQIQVCSPGRLDARRSALLAIGFYLGSDTLRRYGCGDLETTVSSGRRYQRGQRLVIYDAGEDFDRGFEWWQRPSDGKDRLVRRSHPFKNGRSDLLTGSGSKLDIENVNLLATLLIHAEYHGYWRKLGERFEEDMQCLLDRHLLAGLINFAGRRREYRRRRLLWRAPGSFEEAARLRKKSRVLFSRRYEASATSSRGILHEMQSLLRKYRTEVLRQSRLLEQGRNT